MNNEKTSNYEMALFAIHAGIDFISWRVYLTPKRKIGQRFSGEEKTLFVITYKISHYDSNVYHP